MRISGITIPNKRVVFALTALYGIGPSRSAAILKKAKIDSQKKADELTAEEENSIRKQLEGLKLEGDLKREVSGNIKRDRKSTRLNSSHSQISYAVFCLKKKKK